MSERDYGMAEICKINAEYVLTEIIKVRNQIYRIDREIYALGFCLFDEKWRKKRQLKAERKVLLHKLRDLQDKHNELIKLADIGYIVI